MAQQTKLHAAGEKATSVVRAIGYDSSLCLRETSETSECNACVDICPGHAIRMPKATDTKGGVKMTMSKGFCVDCGLCCNVCPTSAFVVLEPTLRRLRHLLKVAQAKAGKDNHAYITCIETGLAAEHPSVVEIPCLGALTRDQWASLMLDFPNLAVYLPGDLCGRCKAKVAESMIVDAVVEAQEMVDRELTLVELRRELDFTDSKGKIPTVDDDGIDLGLGDMMRDITQGTGDDDMTEEERGNSDMRKTRVRLRKELTVAEGEETPGMQGAEGLTGTLTVSRAALLDAVMRFPEIAGRARLDYMKLDAAKCENVDDVIACCPLGAVRRDESGEVAIDKLICVGEACGLCAKVAKGEGAVTPASTLCADLLLNPVEEQE